MSIHSDYGVTRGHLGSMCPPPAPPSPVAMVTPPLFACWLQIALGAAGNLPFSGTLAVCPGKSIPLLGPGPPKLQSPE